MTRKGKIARLPAQIREELNQRLENGEQGVRLIEWLNSLPEVIAILKQDFEGQPINEVNFSQWRNGGFLDWQARVKAEEMVERWPVECGIRSAECGMGGAGSAGSSSLGSDATGCGMSGKGAGDGMANGQSQMAQHGATSGKVAGALTERLMVHYAAALEDAIGEADEKSQKRVQQLGRSLADMARVRRYELAREQVEISREWVAIERERLELERARARSQPKGARDDAEQERLSHLEKAEMVKQMVEDLRKGAAGE